MGAFNFSIIAISLIAITDLYIEEPVSTYLILSYGVIIVPVSLYQIWRTVNPVDPSDQSKKRRDKRQCDHIKAAEKTRLANLNSGTLDAFSFIDISHEMRVLLRCHLNRPDLDERMLALLNCPDAHLINAIGEMRKTTSRRVFLTSIVQLLKDINILTSDDCNVYKQRINNYLNGRHFTCCHYPEHS